MLQVCFPPNDHDNFRKIASLFIKTPLLFTAAAAVVTVGGTPGGGFWMCKAPSAYRTSPIAGDFFCQEYVSYWAACNLQDPMNSCNDTAARKGYADLARLLSLYSCHEYSRIWTCKDCLVAYKRWICSWAFLKCSEDFEKCNGAATPGVDAGIVLLKNSL